MAWHGLTEIKEDLSLENNWLTQWDVQPEKLATTVDGVVAPTDFSILTPTDGVPITIGVPFKPESYRFVTNAEFLQLMKDATEGVEGVKLTSVGSIRNRGRVFASFETMKLAEYEAGGRTFKPYLNFGNGHDKSSCLWANTSNTCTVCDNTFEMNLQKVEDEVIKHSARMVHRKHVIAKLPELALVIRQAVQAQENFAAAFEAMAGINIPAVQAEQAFFGFVVLSDERSISTRAKNIVARLMELFRTGKGNSGKTLADMFQAVTDYYTHENAGNGKNPWKQFASGQFGAGSSAKQDFYLNAAGDRLASLIERGAKLLEKDRE